MNLGANEFLICSGPVSKTAQFSVVFHTVQPVASYKLTDRELSYIIKNLEMYREFIAEEKAIT